MGNQAEFCLEIVVAKAVAAAVAEEQSELIRMSLRMMEAAGSWEDSDWRWGYVRALKDMNELVRSRASGGNGESHLEQKE